jgi:hypothetical protein
MALSLHLFWSSCGVQKIVSENFSLSFRAVCLVTLPVVDAVIALTVDWRFYLMFGSRDLAHHFCARAWFTALFPTRGLCMSIPSEF